MAALGPVIPILRMFDEVKAREFYVGFLGFSVDWEHRFGDDFPLYMQISRARAVLHLSEHHGDATPGSAFRIGVDDIDRLFSEIQEMDYKFARPAIQEQAWGLRELIVGDPFGNRIVFFGTTAA